jgi:transposase
MASQVLSLDIEKIASEEELDGYYCLITSECDRSAREIIEIYRVLYRIEETFRITKSILEVRPVYVSRHDRIIAHFMICYVALVILRLIHSDLGWRYSAQMIAEDIKAMNGVLMDKNYYLFSHRTALSDELGKLCGIDLSRKTLSALQIREIFAKTKKR